MIILKIQDHATLPSFLFPYPILHYSHYFPLLCTMPFFPKENLQLIFQGSTEDLPPISFWHRPERRDLQKLLLTLYIQITQFSNHRELIIMLAHKTSTLNLKIDKMSKHILRYEPPRLPALMQFSISLIFYSILWVIKRQRLKQDIITNDLSTNHSD